MNIIKRESDHCEERRNGAKPTFIVIHYTETKTLEDAEDYFLGRTEHPTGGRVSAHYMIDRDGTVVQYVDESKRAWHAGAGYWDGVDDVNSHSIGIELVNPGRKYGYEPFTAAQMDSLIRLCKAVMTRHAIRLNRVIGHSDLAPGRKKDPGELFEWKMLADAGIGQWPKPEEEDVRLADDYLRDESALREAFTRAGYDPNVDLEQVIVAFQRRFYPEAFRDQNRDMRGKMNREAAARLNWLIRNKPDF